MRECFVFTFEVISQQIQMFNLYFNKYVYVKGEELNVIHVNSDSATESKEDAFAIEKSNSNNKENLEFKSIHLTTSTHMEQLEYVAWSSLMC